MPEHRAALRSLAPRPSPVEPIVEHASDVVAVQTHSNEKWNSLRPEIERLWVRERWKLRHIIEHMGKQHNFKATKQMYKIRFAKWGFKKNLRRSGRSVQEEGFVANERAAIARTRTADLAHIDLRDPGLGYKDSLTLSLLTSVRSCGGAFFDFIRPGPMDGAPSVISKLATGEIGLVDAKYVSFTFKLITELFKRGRGDLAGRVARKAFLSLDGILAIDDPVMVWNLLEIMISLITQRQTQLFSILLNHVLAITSREMESSAPIPTMLRALQRLAASCLEAERQPSTGPLCPHTPSPVRPSEIDKGGSRHTDQNVFCAQILPILQQAWRFNAHILLGHFDPSLLKHYRSMLCEGCSISAPFDSIPSWANAMRENEPSPMKSPARAEAGLRYFGKDLAGVITFDERNTSLAALREHWGFMVENSASSERQSKALMPTLASLAIATLLDTWAATTAEESHQYSGLEVGKLYATNLATALRTLTELEEGAKGDAGQGGVSLEALERGRKIVALSDYAHGRYSPQAVRELCLLEDSLVAAGEEIEARAVRQDIFHRAEVLAEDIPVASA